MNNKIRISTGFIGGVIFALGAPLNLHADAQHNTPPLPQRQHAEETQIENQPSRTYRTYNERPSSDMAATNKSDKHMTHQQGSQDEQVVLLPADKLMGRSITDSDGEDMGEISDIILQVGEPRIAYFAVEKGDILGIGGETKYVPADQVSINDDETASFHGTSAQAKQDLDISNRSGLVSIGSLDFSEELVGEDGTRIGEITSVLVTQDGADLAYLMVEPTINEQGYWITTPSTTRFAVPANSITGITDDGDFRTALTNAQIEDSEGASDLGWVEFDESYVSPELDRYEINRSELQANTSGPRDRNSRMQGGNRDYDAHGTLAATHDSESQSYSDGTEARRKKDPEERARRPRPAQSNPNAQQVTLIPAETLNGWTVTGSDGKEVGQVSDLILRPGDTSIAYIEVTKGGVLGIGGESFLIPASAVTPSGKDGSMKLNQRSDEVDRSQSFKSGQNMVRASDLDETEDLNGSDGNQVGRLSGVLVTNDATHAAYFMVEPGFEALGYNDGFRDGSYAIPAESITSMDTNGDLETSLTESQIESADEASDLGWITIVSMAPEPEGRRYQIDTSEVGGSDSKASDKQRSTSGVAMDRDY